MRPPLAIIGGSALESFDGLKIVEQLSISTRYGEPSAPVTLGELAGQDLMFLSRHGQRHQIAPHKINYRANIDALHQAGAGSIVAINTVGAINGDFCPGDIVIPDQLIDFTWGREGTYFDGEMNPLKHIDFTEPFDAGLRADLLRAGSEIKTNCHDGGTYACVQGPRLETAAEIRKLKNDGCDLVGMTACPEAALAAEFEIRYASVCLVVNPAAGLSKTPLSETQIMSTARSGMHNVCRLIEKLLS